MPAPA